VSPPPAAASRREIWSWALYDFANSAFALAILAVIFPRYYQRSLGGSVESWGYANSAALVVSAILMPVVGAICDYTAAKKRTLLAFWLLGCAATCALVMVPAWVAAAIVFVIALVGFEASTALNNGFLPEIAAGNRSGWVSSLGFATGYVGGALHLILAYLVIQFPGWFGMSADSILPTRIAIASVGVWWFLFALPMVFWLKERAVVRALPPGDSLLRAGFRKVTTTIRNIRRFPTLARFTLAFLLFNDGVSTVIIMSSTFGDQVLGMGQQEMIQCFLLIQLVAAGGSFFFAWLARRLGEKRALVLSLLVWSAAVVWAFFMRTRIEFWLMGIVIGLVLGGTQAIARSLLARFTPPSCAGEFFGFYAVTGKLASALGPVLFALAIRATGDVRFGILSVIIVFGAGLFILLPVDEARGVAEAEAEERRLTAGAEGG
jgi:UMF1 family MFS transporter